VLADGYKFRFSKLDVNLVKLQELDSKQERQAAILKQLQDVRKGRTREHTRAGQIQQLTMSDIEKTSVVTPEQQKILENLQAIREHNRDDFEREMETDTPPLPPPAEPEPDYKEETAGQDIDEDATGGNWLEDDADNFNTADPEFA
jgi:hypothetical protein